jgi:O-antigen ligase
MPLAIPFLVFIGVLWVAGGASRVDVAGQVISRVAAWAALVAVILLADRRSLIGDRRVLALLVAVIALPLVQLIPLPPSWWSALPGRRMFLEAASVAGMAQPWRPWAIVPSATRNALFSLVVPLATYFLIAGFDRAGHLLMLRTLLVLVVASTLVGLVQFSGVNVDNPFVNGSGEVNGMFANHNHFALFVAMGCLLAPVWAFHESRKPGWQHPVALGLIALFILTILASGSRAGMIAGLIAVGGGFLVTQGDARKALRRYPRWVFPTLIATAVAGVAGLILLSVMSDRAMAIHRAMTVDVSQDLRARALPVVLDMIREYFPMGSGFGAFDPLFRMHEPFALLRPTYFNQAHNDFLAIVLDGGLSGLVLLVLAIGWWARASLDAWRSRAEDAGSRRTGSVMLLMIFAASVFDYPARTPMIMAVVVIAAILLGGYVRRSDASALRQA